MMAVRIIDEVFQLSIVEMSKDFIIWRTNFGWFTKKRKSRKSAYLWTIL